jgi:hypothetical protein
MIPVFVCRAGVPVRCFSEASMRSFAAIVGQATYFGEPSENHVDRLPALAVSLKTGTGPIT